MKNVYTVSAVIIIMMLPRMIQAQNIFPANGSVGIGTATPDASSIFEISSTAKGMLIPRMTRTQRDAIASPAVGLMIYQTNSTPGFYYFDGSAWKQVAPNGVNKSLSNLAGPTAINADLLPNVPSGHDLGSYSFTWKDAYVDGNIYSNGYKFISHRGTANTFIGIETALVDSTGSYNTGSGAYALCVNSTGNYNTASGYASLYLNTTGTENSAFGALSLRANSTGSYNTAVGSSALRMNTFGIDNVAVGSYSLYNNISGVENAAIGRSSMYSNTTGYWNTAAGSEAMYNVTTAANCTAIGYRSLYSNPASGNNTAVGSLALFNTTQANNTAIGYQALYSNTTGSNNVACGSYALANGTTNAANAAVGYYAGFNCIASSFCSFFGDGADQTTSSVFTNSTALGYNSRVTATSQVRVGNSNVNSIGGYVNWTNISDGRFKKNIRENVPGLAFINKLKPVTYNLDVTGLNSFLHESVSYDKDGKKLSVQPDEKTNEAIQKKERQIQTGFVAQDVEKAAKDLGYDFSGVDKPENENTPYGLRYAEFVVPLVKAVQELSKQNDELKQQYDAQQKEMEELKNMISTSQAKTGAVPKDNRAAAVFSTEIKQALLSQNMPNPFNHTTTINYTIPQTVTNARITITDETGRNIKTINVSGSGSLTLDASALASGTYHCSLYVNGKLTDSKTMQLLK